MSVRSSAKRTLRGSCKRPLRTYRPRFERLEDRCLLAAVMVDDINVHPTDGQPENLVAVGQTLFFTAHDQNRYATPILWKSDGTTAGTVKVKDIRSRPDGGATFYEQVAVGNTLYFTAAADNGIELWKSDGTAAGTVVVKTVAASGLTAVGNTLYFAATDSGGNELWKSDGTAAGTVRIKDIRPGSSGSAPWYPTAVGNQLYFVADDGTTGKELWKSDGTDSGTVRVADLNPNSGASDPQSLVVVGTTVFFIATDGVNGYRMYKTDGTTTALVGNISFPTQQSSTNRTLVAAGTNVYFNLNKSELWKTDGTVGGTSLVATIPNTEPYITFTDFVAVNSTLYFTARDDTHGFELWRSDGTPGGTVLVKDLYPGTFPDLLDSPLELTRVGQSVYLLSNDLDLWKSDGTDAGTVLVKSFEALSGSTSARPRQLTGVGNQLFLSADDATAGYELWRSDGTAGGTRLVKDLRTGTVGSDATPLGFANGRLYLNADEVVREIFSNGRYPTLWKTDGTAAGTSLAFEQPIISFAGFYGVITLGSSFYFGGKTGAVHHLFKTNGTQAGTQDLYTGLQATDAVVVGSRFFFNGNDEDSELWVSNGTAAGTYQVKDIWPDFYSSNPYNITPFGNGVLFAANDGTHGSELWKSDGTAAGTVLVKDILPGTSGSSIASMRTVNGIAVFTAWDGSSNVRPALWRSDGTAAGTYRLKDMDAANFFTLGSTLYFAGDDASGVELWKTDGTIAGTTLVKNISQFGDSNPNNFANIGTTLYFTAHASYGAPITLWKSDGTTAGTEQVLPGIWGSGTFTAPRELHAVGATLFFVANDGQTGLEIWQSDGTAAGTKLGGDIYPGSSGSEPADLIVYQNSLYFSADDGLHGRELWKVSPPINAMQNPGVRFDVDNDGQVNLDDVVLVIQYMRAQTRGLSLPVVGPPYWDPTGDGLLKIDDALDILKEIRDRRALGLNGEGETGLDLASAPAEPLASLWPELSMEVAPAKKRRLAIDRAPSS